jgi:uncharacterized protein (TIGR03437 family)
MFLRSLTSFAALFCCVGLPLAGQVITTLAGTNSLGPANGTPALQAAIGPNLVTSDPQGNIYFIDQNTLVMKISAQGAISRFAGNGIRGYSGDGGPAIDASVNGPNGIYADSSGNVFLADTANYRIRKIDSNGIITTIAGNGQDGVSPEGTIAVNASIGESYSVAEDSLGNIYFADSENNRIAKIDAHGLLTTVAGKAKSPGYSGDNGPATAAQLTYPLSITIDPSNNIIIADTSLNVIRVVNTSGIIKTLAGTGQPGYSGDNGPAASALLNQPWTVSADLQGNILLVDYDNDVIRKISTNGVITTVAGNAKAGLGTDNVPATSSSLYYPFGVSAEAAGSFLIADFSNNTIRRVSTSGIISTIAGNGFKAISPNGGAASSAILAAPTKVAIDNNGNLLIADWNNQLLERVTLSNGTISAIAGIGRAAYTGDNVPAATAGLNFPQGITTDHSGNIYFSDTFNERIRKIDTTGTITTIAGIGQSGYQGDGGQALKANLSVPQGLRFDPSGNLVFADSNNHVIRSISPQGIITTIAGTGTPGYNHDGVPATQSQLYKPTDVAFDAAGNLYIADSVNNRVRRVDLNKNITTVAGTGTGGFSGDGVATSVQLFTPTGINFDNSGNLMIADRDNNRLRILTPTGQIKTIAGDGVQRLNGDGSLAMTASMAAPEGVVMDGAGNIFIADSRNDRIREILGAPATFSTSAGPLTFAASSGGPVTSSQPLSIAGSVPGLAFTATASAPWIVLSSAAGSLPATISLSVDPSQLSVGTSNGSVTIVSPLTAVPSTTVNIIANISAAQPPSVALSASAVNLSIIRGPQGATEATGTFSVLNNGGGTVTATVGTPPVPWLTTSAASPLSVTPNSPVDVTLTTVSSTLASGTYSTQVTVDGGTAGLVTLQVTLTIVDARPKIQLSQVGMTFSAVAQGGAPLPQSFGILNSGQGSMSWTANASTLSGGAWLSIDQTSGTVATPLASVSTVNVTVNPAGLAAGNYYGQVQIQAQGADNSPQIVSIVLNVMAAGTHLGPAVGPTAVTFVGSAASSPGSQVVMLANLSASPLTFQSTLTTDTPGATWLQYAPVSATINPGQPAQISVQTNFANLSAGAHNGSLTFIFSDGSIRTVSILTVVSSGGGGSAPINPNAKLQPFAASCSSSLAVQPTTLTDPSSSVPLSQPASVQAKVVDNCGNPFTSGSVSVSFSDGDSQVNLVHVGNGNWSGTWLPRNGSQPQVKLTYVAIGVQGITAYGGSASLTVSLTSGAASPLTAGVANSASGAGAFISPGGLVSIYGQDLATSTGGGGNPPFPTQVNGTQVLMGGQTLPLRYVGAGQVNAQVPFGLATNTQQQLVVQRGTTLSVPQDVVVAAAQPGIYTQNASGSGPGIIVDASQSYQLVTSQTPAAAGDVLVIYCNGLGAVNPAIPTGTPAPLAGPLSYTVNPVTLTIGGISTPVAFAGLAPGYPDLYQVNTTVPAGLPSGTQVPVVLSVAGQSSPPVTISVR